MSHCRGGTLYFARAGRYVKIGITTNLSQRLSAVRCGCPERITVLYTRPGTEADERALHRLFAQVHVRGEWFLFDGPVADFVTTQRWLDELIDELENPNETGGIATGV